MVQPTSRAVHVDAHLTNIAINYTNPSFIADTIFPVVGVNKQSDLLPTFDQSPWFRDSAKLRAPGTKSEGGGWTFSRDNYYAHRFSFRTEVSDEVRDNADDGFNLDTIGTNLCMRMIGLRKEVAFATDFFKPGVWGSDEVGGTDFTQWSDYSASMPFPVFTDNMDAIEAKVGIEPNTLVLGKAVWNKLRWHPDLIDTIKQVERGIPTVDLLQSATGINRILIGSAIQTTDPEGTAENSVTYTRIWGPHALLLYVPAGPSLLEPASGYTFTWNRVPNSLAYMLRYRDDQRETDILEGNTYFDQKATAPRAGVFFHNAVAA